MHIDRTLYHRPRLNQNGVIAVSLASVLVCGCGDGQSSNAPTADTSPPPAILHTEVFTVQPSAWAKVVRTQGSLFADEVAVIGAKIAGRVAEAHVDLGDSVEPGTQLVTLDHEEFRIQVAQAEAQLQQTRAAVGLRPSDPLEKLDPENAAPVREAKAIWDEAGAKDQRARQLRSQNVMTQQELEEINAAEQVAASRYASAINGVNEKIALIGVRTAELDLAKQRLADAVITAPFAGLVQERHIAPGSFVQIGDPIITLVSNHPVHFRGKIPERFARHLTLGQEVRLVIESMASPLIVKVTRIDPSLDPLSRSLLFEAEVDNAAGQLRTGLFAEAQVVIDTSAESIVVPESAVVEFAGVEKVWKVVDGTSREHVILTGERRDGKVEIVEGLVPGDVLLLHAEQGRAARVEPIEVPATLTLLSTETQRPLEGMRRNSGESVEPQKSAGIP